MRAVYCVPILEGTPEDQAKQLRQKALKVAGKSGAEFVQFEGDHLVLEGSNIQASDVLEGLRKKFYTAKLIYFNHTEDTLQQEAGDNAGSKVSNEEIQMRAEYCVPILAGMPEEKAKQLRRKALMAAGKSDAKSVQFEGDILVLKGGYFDPSAVLEGLRKKKFYTADLIHLELISDTQPQDVEVFGDSASEIQTMFDLQEHDANPEETTQSNNYGSDFY